MILHASPLVEVYSVGEIHRLEFESLGRETRGAGNSRLGMRFVMSHGVDL